MFPILTAEQYKRYYEIMNELLYSGLRHFGRTFEGDDIYTYKNAFLTITPQPISEKEWKLEVSMTLLKNNARGGDFHLAAFMYLDSDDENSVVTDAKILLEDVEDTLDHPPKCMTRELDVVYSDFFDDDHKRE